MKKVTLRLVSCIICAVLTATLVGCASDETLVAPESTVSAEASPTETVPPSSEMPETSPIEPEGQEDDADDAWMQALANAYLPRETRESPPNPEKDYGLTFYLGLIRQNFDIFSRGVWSIAPAGTEDWVYLDSDLGMKGEAYCTFTHDSDEKLNYSNAAHGCTDVHKMYGDIDGCVSEKWRLRFEIFPFEEFWIFYREGDCLYSCYIWEDVTITGDDTLVRINRDWEKNTGEVKNAMEILALTTAAESLPMVFCGDCPAEWKPVWRMEECALFDELSLSDGQEPVILDVNESHLLVSLSRDFPQDSPYWHEGGGISSYTEGVCLLDVQTGEILSNVLFADGLTYCGSGVLMEDGFAIQILHHDRELEGKLEYEIVRYFTDGTEPDILQDYSLYATNASQMFRVREYIAYTTNGILNANQGYEMHGFDVIDYCGYELGKGVLRGNGKELAYYTERDGMGEDVGTVWITITSGYQYGTVRTFSLESGYSIADFCFRDYKLLFSRFVLQEDGTRGEPSLLLLNSAGDTLAETVCPVHFDTLTPLSDGAAFARGADGYLYLIRWNDAGITMEKTAIKGQYRLLYPVDESNCLVWDYREDSLWRLTCR